jgi:hypothetical protein
VSFHNDAFDWTLINTFTDVGYSSDSGKRQHVLPLLTGVEFERPLGNRKRGGEQVYLHWHLAYPATSTRSGGRRL